MTIKADVKSLGDTIVLYFGTDGKQINAYTLASALVSFRISARHF